MKKNTTRGIRSSRSRCSKRNLPPEKIIVSYIYRNGEIIFKEVEARYYTKYKENHHLYSLEQSCPCCQGKLGIIIKGKEENHIFCCIGLSCLLTLIDKIKRR